MDDAAPSTDQPCPGIQITALEIDPEHALIIVVTEPLGCPACGGTGSRWVIETFSDKICHREPLRRDPGE